MDCSVYLKITTLRPIMGYLQLCRADFIMVDFCYHHQHLKELKMGSEEWPMKKHHRRMSQHQSDDKMEG